MSICKIQSIYKLTGTSLESIYKLTKIFRQFVHWLILHIAWFDKLTATYILGKTCQFIPSKSTHSLQPILTRIVCHTNKMPMGMIENLLELHWQRGQFQRNSNGKRRWPRKEERGTLLLLIPGAHARRLTRNRRPCSSFPLSAPTWSKAAMQIILFKGDVIVSRYCRLTKKLQAWKGPHNVSYFTCVCEINKIKIVTKLFFLHCREACNKVIPRINQSEP